MADQILVTGTLEFNPDNHDDVVAAMVAMMDATRAEEGNISYTFSADLSTPGRFYVTEEWASQAAMDSHNGSAHMAEFMGSMGDLGATGASITAWHDASPQKLI